MGGGESVIHRLKLRHLRLVLAVSEATSLAQVAERLCVSPAAVSKALNEVESLFDQPLFERGRGWIRPTVLGDAVIASARVVHAELSALSQRADSLGSGHQGELRIGIKAVSLHPFLAQVITRFSAAYPLVRIRLVEGDAQSLLQQTAEGQVPLLVARLSAAISQAGLSGLAVQHDQAVVVASGGHPLAGQPDLTWEAALQYPWCLPVPGTLMRDLLEKTLLAEGLAMPSRFVETSDMTLVAPLFRHAHWLTIVPRRVAQRFLAPPVGHMLPLAASLPDDAVGIIWNDRLPMLPTAAQFLAHARLELETWHMGDGMVGQSARAASPGDSAA